MCLASSLCPSKSTPLFPHVELCVYLRLFLNLFTSIVLIIEILLFINICSLNQWTMSVQKKSLLQTQAECFWMFTGRQFLKNRSQIWHEWDNYKRLEQNIEI